MHPSLEQLKDALNGTPYESQLWLVGGAVRDELLGGEASADFDLVSELDVVRLANNLFQQGILDSAPAVFEQFGTVMIQIGGSQIELVTARKESYRGDSRKPDVEPATLLEDALRRDFTVNALLKNLTTGEVKDLLGSGLADLKNGVLRTPGDPEETFSQDPLRMLRAVRFKYKLGFSLEPSVADAIKAQASRLDIISVERIREEWTKMLVGPTPWLAMRDLLELNLLDKFAPEFRAMVGVDQGKYHHLDVWNHTLLVLQNISRGGDQVIRSLAALLHDVGKPATRKVDDEGQVRFFGHESVGGEMTRNLMGRLRFSGDDTDKVVSLVQNHMRLGSFSELSTPAARRLIRDMGPQLEDLLDLVEADKDSLKPGVIVMDLDPIRAKLAQVSAEVPASMMRSPLDGRELILEFGVEAGPEIGRIKGMLEEAVIDGICEACNKGQARRLVEEYLKNQKP